MEEGQGIESCPNGSKYVGGWKNGFIVYGVVQNIWVNGRMVKGLTLSSG